MYDSTKDTVEHIKRVQDVFNSVIIPELQRRAVKHDSSKLESPEKETYDKYIPMLREVKYGTKEYLELRDKMKKEGLSHHFKVNRHHPEHFPNSDISHMNIVDIVEMIVDWYAASLVSDTSFEAGLKGNAERYHIPSQLVSIMKNTVTDLIKK